MVCLRKVSVFILFVLFGSFLFGVLSTGIGSAQGANTFYVSATATGSGTGTQASPFTLNQAWTHSNTMSNTELTYLLAPGNYPSVSWDYTNFASRTAWMKVKAQIPSQRPVILDSIRIRNNVATIVKNVFVEFDGIEIYRPAYSACVYSSNLGPEGIGSVAYLPAMIQLYRVSKFVLKNSEVHAQRIFDGGSIELWTGSELGTSIPLATSSNNPAVLFENNEIHDITMFFDYRGGTGVGELVVRGNTFYRFPGALFDSGGNGNVYENNHIYNFGSSRFTNEPCYVEGNWRVAHGAVIALRGTVNTVIRGNNIHSGRGPTGIIYMYGGNHHGYIIENNLLYDLAAGTIFWSSVGNAYIDGPIIFRHNTFIARENPLWPNAFFVNRFTSISPPDGVPSQILELVFNPPVTGYYGAGTVVSDNIILGKFQAWAFGGSSPTLTQQRNIVYTNSLGNGNIWLANGNYLSDYIDNQLFNGVVFSNGWNSLNGVITTDYHDLNCAPGQSSQCDLTPLPTSIACDPNFVGPEGYIGAIPCDGSVPTVEICTDGVDNDGDILVDCADSYCFNHASCNMGNNCQITNAEWSVANVDTGEPVQLIVEGMNCDGEEVQVEIYEDDFGGDDESLFPGDDAVLNNPDPKVFVNGVVTFDWNAQWQSDGILGLGGTPEYYFVASLTNGDLTSKSSLDNLQFGLLTVNSVPVGDLSGELLSSGNLEVNLDGSFNYNVEVSCSGGYCGDVDVGLENGGNF
jgi:hypothetical protein